MHRLLTTLALLIALTLASGCACACVNTRTPYLRDLNNTPFRETTAGGRVIQIHEPFSGYVPTPLAILPAATG